MAIGTTAPQMAFNDQLKADAEFWSRTYQTGQDSAKIQDFINDVMTYQNASGAIPINKAISAARPAFDGDSGTDGAKLSRILLYIALHESEGGKHDHQLGDGPARGWWQVEPVSARSIVKDSGAMWGRHAEAVTGYSLRALVAMPDKELAALLMVPVFCCVMAAFITITHAQHRGELDYLR